MIVLALIFLGVAAGAAAVAFGGAQGLTAMLAKAVFIAAVLLFIVAVVGGVFRSTLRSLTSLDERRS